MSPTANFHQLSFSFDRVFCIILPPLFHQLSGFNVCQFQYQAVVASNIDNMTSVTNNNDFIFDIKVFLNNIERRYELIAHGWFCRRPEVKDRMMLIKVYRSSLYEEQTKAIN